MRIQVVFIILLVLLGLARAADLVTAVGQIRLTNVMERLWKEPNPQTADSNRKLAALEEEQGKYVEDATLAAIEFLMLGGVGFCFLRVWRKNKRDSVA